MEKKEIKSEQIHFRVTTELKRKLDKEAKRQFTTVTKIIENALEVYFEKR